MAYQTSQGLASLGRNGDSVLVHMSPTEVAGLQGLAMSQGGSLTINPHTGLPEAFSLGGLFSSILPMFAGAMFPGAGFAMQPLLAGALTGGVLAKVQGKDPLMGGLMGGLGGMSGSNLAFGLKGAATPAAAATSGYVPPPIINGVAVPTPSQIASNIDPSMINTGLNVPNVSMMNATNLARNTGMIGGAGTLDPIIDNFTKQASGVGNLVTGKPGAFDAFKNAFAVDGAPPLTNFQAATKIGMPVGGAILGGLEPSDIYGKPINMDEAKKKQAYDPTRSLNLSGDTGLRLYAGGGSIQSGGIRDLYGTPDNQPTMSSGLGGFGLGRLNDLANEQARTQAQTYGYAMGGPISFADGGDSNKDIMGLPSLSPDTSMDPNAGANNPAMVQSIMGAMQENAPMTQGQASEQNNDSLIAKVTSSLRADPNYQPTNPIEASIVKQIKGNDPMQQGQLSQQGLGSIAPSQPMAPSYNPSVAMGPTYFAGINAPQGYADGGDVSGSPSADVAAEIALSGIDPTLVYGDMVDDRARLPYMYDRILTRGALDAGRISPIEYSPYTYAGATRRREGMARGGYLNGAGDGMSDSIPATIEGKQPARLADGEFVVPADVVSHLGNGSSKAGSKRLYAMLDKIRHARTGNKKQGKQINPSKYMPA